MCYLNNCVLYSMKGYIGKQLTVQDYWSQVMPLLQKIIAHIDYNTIYCCHSENANVKLVCDLLSL